VDEGEIYPYRPPPVQLVVKGSSACLILPYLVLASSYCGLSLSVSACLTYLILSCRPSVADCQSRVLSVFSCLMIFNSLPISAWHSWSAGLILIYAVLQSPSRGLAVIFVLPVHSCLFLPCHPLPPVADRQPGVVLPV
jgi:hypothetical protein